MSSAMTALRPAPTADAINDDPLLGVEVVEGPAAGLLLNAGCDVTAGTT